jgi:hypothetical protein
MAFPKSLVDKKVHVHLGHGAKFGYILVYVYLKDEAFLGVEITEQSYGFAHSHIPFTYMEEFSRYEGEESETAIGIINSHRRGMGNGRRKKEF